MPSRSFTRRMQEKRRRDDRVAGLVNSAVVGATGSAVRASGSTQPHVRITVDSGPAVGTMWMALPGVYTFGRGSEPPWSLGDESTAAPEHARLTVGQDGSAWIEDLGTTEGTFIDYRKVDGRSAIRDGASVKLGETVLRFDQVDQQGSNRGYNTPVVADLETGVRRIFRFELKLFLGFLILIALGIGIGLFVITQHDNRIVTVPSLTGLNNVSVAEALDSVGLNEQEIDRTSNVPFNQFISSTPPPGSRVKAGTTVVVVMSNGPGIP
jgi:hypothetical protein